MKQTNVIFVTFTVLLVVGLLWVLLSVEFIDKYRQQFATANNNGAADILFFFRVPKTGSEMTVMLLQWLQGVNTFRHIRLKNTNYRRLGPQEQAELRRQVIDTWKAGSNPIPVAFDRHVYFTDLNSNVNDNKILYFSSIRDPIERIVSQFYYSRVTPRPGLKLPANVTTPAPMRYHTFEECADSTDPECSYVTGSHYDLQIPYFCGHEEHCTELNNVKALEKAINNVKHFFPVVGVLELLNCTLRVAETKITPFFKGIQQMYFDELLQPKRNKNYNRPKRLLRSDVEKALKINLTLEYQFYHYVKERLQIQCLES